MGVSCPSRKSAFERRQTALRKAEGFDEDYVYTCCRPARRVFAFILDPWNIIDILAILPWYMEHILAPNADVPGLTFVRILRLLRVVRLMKVLKLSTAVVEYSEAVLIFLQVFERSAQALSIGILYTAVLMVLLGAIIFVAEQGEWNP